MKPGYVNKPSARQNSQLRSKVLAPHLTGGGEAKRSLNFRDRKTCNSDGNLSSEAM